MNWYRPPPWWWGWAAPLAGGRRNRNHTCVKSCNIIYQGKMLTNTHSTQQRSMHYTAPCIEFPHIPFYIISTRFQSRKVHVIGNGTNHHFGFDFRKKGTWRYARLRPLVVGHGMCSTHFLAGNQFVIFQIPDRYIDDEKDMPEHHLCR